MSSNESEQELIIAIYSVEVFRTCTKKLHCLFQSVIAHNVNIV